MIERQILQRKIREYQIEEFISTNLDKEGYSHTEIKRTPLGEKITIFTSKPGLIVGREGSNIRSLADTLKKKFKLENPQVEVSEIENPNINSKYVAKNIVHVFEKYGPKRFKSVGYKKLQDIMNAGAVGAEIIISGRGVPSQRAKRWRFKAGYLKKSGDISENYVERGYAIAHLRSGAVGVQVRILNPEVRLADAISYKTPSINSIKDNHLDKKQIASDIVIETKKKDQLITLPRKKTIKPKKSKKEPNKNDDNKEN